MSERRLPKLEEDKNISKSASCAISHIENIAYVLTSLSSEADDNNLVSMSYVLSKLSDDLQLSADRINSFIRCVEYQKEKNVGAYSEGRYGVD